MTKRNSKKRKRKKEKKCVNELEKMVGLAPWVNFISAFELIGDCWHFLAHNI